MPGSLLSPSARAVVLTAAIAFAGCNSLLDNQPAHLSEERLGTEPTDGGEVARVAERDADASTPTDEARRDADGPVPPTCPVGTKPCDGACVSTSNPKFGCGGPTCERCATVHATAACAATACAVAKCEAGWANCNDVVSDGCETDLSLAATCGACGITCLPRPHAEVACTSLACTTTCEPGRGDCNGNPEDGCERDLLEDRLNCGACGRVCIVGRCREGACRLEL